MEKITSRQNKIVSHFRLLGRDRPYREKCGEYVCDGAKLLDEALKWGAEITSVLYASGIKPSLPENVPTYELPQELMDYVSPLQNSQGLLFSVKMRGKAAKVHKSTIVLEGIQDPGNLGTIVRTANALSIDCVILTDGCADLYNPKTIRAAMGAVFRQCIMKIPASGLVETLQAWNMKLYGAALTEQAGDIRKTNLQNSAVVIGSEGRGLSELMLSLCDGQIIIPMNPECESLNASAAAAIVMWELSGQGAKKK